MAKCPHHEPHLAIRSLLYKTATNPLAWALFATSIAAFFLGEIESAVLTLTVAALYSITSAVTLWGSEKDTSELIRRMTRRLDLVMTGLILFFSGLILVVGTLRLTTSGTGFAQGVRMMLPFVVGLCLAIVPLGLASAMAIATALNGRRLTPDSLARLSAFTLPMNCGLACFVSWKAAFGAMDQALGQFAPPLFPMQVLLINLVFQLLPATSLALEKGTPDTIPNPSSNPVFSPVVFQRIFMISLLIALTACTLFAWEYRGLSKSGMSRGESTAHAQSIVLVTLAMFQVFYMLHGRSLTKPLRREGWIANPFTYAAIVATTVLLGLVLFLDPVRNALNLVTPDLKQLPLVLLATFPVIPILSFEKWLRPRVWKTEIPPDDVRLGARASLSQDFQAILEKADGNSMTVGEIMDLLEVRGHALLLVFFSLPLCLPVGIPILTSLLGPLLAFVSFFLALGRRPWLPRRIRNRSIPHDKLEHLIERVQPMVTRLERHLHYRLLLLSEEGLPVRLHALYMMVLALVISIPLPILFFNLVAAVPIVLLSLGLLKRDGVFIVAAYITAIPCVIMYTALAVVGIEGIRHLLGLR